MPIGPRVLFESAAKIVDIRTSGPFRARFSTFVHPATKNEPYSMLNTWPRICFLIYRIGNLFLRFPRFSDHTLNRISDLFGEVSRLVFSLLSDFFSLAAGQELLCACVVSYQSFGEFARFHPHWHVLVLEGGFTKYDRFVYLPIGADEGMLKVWQAAILALFLRKELIDQARVNMLKDWKHSGFSIESETRLFSKADREALGQYVVRGATCAEKIQYDPASDTVIWTASPKGFYKGKTETFKGFEFVDQLVAHLPPRRVQLVRRYGVYAGKVRKQWQERPNIYSLAPESWQKGHPRESKIVPAIPQGETGNCPSFRCLVQVAQTKLGTVVTESL